MIKTYLININQTILYKKHLSEPWFSLVHQKKKTNEGRLNKGDFKDMNRLNKEDIIEFFNNDSNNSDVKKYRVKVIGKHRYKTFRNMIKAERLKNVLPCPTVKPY